MVWGSCLIFFGVALGVIGLSVHMLGYAIVGGIMVLGGIFWLVSVHRQRRYLGAKPEAPLNKPDL